MWARVSRFEVPKDRLDEDIRDARKVTAELVKRTEGSRGIYYLVDRGTGHTMVVTLWDSEEALRASEQEATRLREESAGRLDETIVSVERFEVALEPSDVMAATR